MSSSELTTPRAVGIRGLARSVPSLLQGLGRAVAPPVMRVALALPFFRSGLTRWDGVLHVSDATRYLFSDIFRLHILGGAYPIPVPELVSTLTAIAEIVLPLMLIAGLGTRLAALGLLAMTGVIQLVQPDGWANFHLYWAALALGILATGPGALSLDRLIARALRSRGPAA
jgi:putative oxidoreductase